MVQSTAHPFLAGMYSFHDAALHHLTSPQPSATVNTSTGHRKERAGIVMGMHREMATDCCIGLRQYFAALVPVFSMQSPHCLTGDPQRDLSSCIRLSFDPRDTWVNGIYENSRHATFMVDFAGMKLQLLSSHDCGKFRQTSFKDWTDLRIKLSRFIRENTRTA